MAPSKTILTIDALDEHTALELPERELMCGCGGLLNVNLGVSASVNLGSVQTSTTCYGGASGISLGACVGITTGSGSCNS